MKIYVEAYRADGSQILGTLDGQRVWSNVRNYKRTRAYKLLKDGAAKYDTKAAFWRIVTEQGKILETIYR